MRKPAIRIIALTMLLALIVGLLPISAFAASAGPQEANKPKAVHVFTEEENAILDQDVFADIESVKADAATRRGGIGKLTEQDYINLIPQVIEAVKNSDTYVPGTLQQNGYFLVWETTVGMPCCYDPRMEAELHNTTNDPTPEEVARAEAEALEMLEEFSPVKGGPYSMNIGLIQPYWESSSVYSDASFLNYSPQYKALWENLCNATGGEGIRYSMTNATVDNVAYTMSECGFVMFDSHGTTDYSSGGDYTSRANCSYLCLTTSAGITSADTAPQTGEFGTYYHCMRSGSAAYVSGTCIANHMTDYAPNSYLYMGICLGMATDGMEAGLRDKGVEAVYGYSQSVSFVGDMAYMSAINNALKDGELLSTAVAAAKESVGPWDYYSSHPTIGQARADDCAFPIVVSTEDPYPGHGNVDDLQTVDSTWSLFGTNYEITAVSNNTEWGTVSILGSTVTATPSEGYYADNCIVLSGTAEITKKGNRFIVHASSDCTVQVNFAPKSPVTITYVANGSVYTTASGYASDELALPSTAPQVEDWTFKGWVLEAVEESYERPVFLKPGSAFTPYADTTIFALYTKAEGASGEMFYELVSETPEDWAGNYVISYGTDSSMYVFKGVTPSSDGARIEDSTNASTYAQAGVTLEENALYNVDDDYVFTLEAHDNYFSLQSLSTGAFVGLDSTSYLAGYMTYASGTCNWTPGPTDGYSCLKNAVNGTYPYFSFSSSGHYFWSGSLNSSNIRLWKETALCNWVYSTNPGNVVHTHSMEFVEAVQPTCGAAGHSAYYHCITCGKYFSDEDGVNEITLDSTVLAATDDHSFGDWSSNNNGTHTRHCAVCGNGETENCSYDSTVTPPTCTAGGYTTFHCATCDYSCQGDPVDPLGHDWSEWAVIHEPTCAEPGEKEHTCSRCSAAETEVINQLGHDYVPTVVAPTCIDGGYTSYICSRCNDSHTGDETAPLGHDFGDWSFDTEPTCTESGVQSHSCSRCEAVENRTVEALGHLWDVVVTKEPTVEEEGTCVYTCTRCGASETVVIPKLEHPNPFADVHYGKYFFDAVMWGYYHTPQITGGTDETHFSPYAPCTREQIVFFLWAAAGKPAPSTTTTAFVDVNAGKYYYDAVLWAQEKGITKGVTETMFGVGRYCTREQIVTFLWRFAGSQDPMGEEEVFTGVPANAYYAKAVRWASEIGITGGTGNNSFSPKKICTRAEVITFLYRCSLILVQPMPLSAVQE